jgi:hypothetical protein
MLRRRGKYRPEDFTRLLLARPVELTQLKKTWLVALDEAEHFIGTRPPDELGCLYFDTSTERFVDPSRTPGETVVPHFGRPGGLLPRVLSD